MFITRILFLSILHTYFKTVYTNEASVNGTTELRQPRVTGRIVKIYSGTKSEPIHCEGEGFQGDPLDCAVFYRCIEANNGKYTIFRFQCGPGTIYDPETEICNHPKNTKRSECINISERKAPAAASFENEIENEALDELPLPINRLTTINSRPSITDNRGASSALPWGLTAQQQQELTTKGPVKIFRQFPAKPQPHQSGKACITTGFMGDDQDCRKFYRCVGNERGRYIKYEFSCSETTVWDDETQSCNHPWSTKRSHCSSVQDSDANNSDKQEQIDDKNYGNKVPNLSISPEKLSTTYLPTKIKDVSLPEPVTSSHINQEMEKQNQYSDQEDNDDSTQTDNGSGPEGNKCTKSGFMGNNRNCNKFYRCVDNGMGSYTRYEFSCGDGTVWDASINSCNHVWAVKGCGGSSSSEDSAATTTTTTRRPSSTTQQTTTIEDVEDGGYGGNSNQDSESSSSVQTERPMQTTHATTSQCKSSGFIGDANDCKKFYRCVDDGNGSYTKYEFSCGEGTVWDQSIEGCNHAWAVDKCGGSTVEYNKEETTSPKPTTQTQSTQNDNSDVGYGEQQEETMPETTTKKHQSEGAQTAGCQSSGFLGDKSDCKKFYRCVDDGKGGFIKYEFTCGEGTVWDQEIQACNHPLKEGCKKGSTESHTEEPNDGNQETTKSPEKTTTQATQNTSQKPSSSTETSGDDTCVAEGFYANSNDCKKFYRCVNNGNEGFTKYDFSCGEGTVWVQEIQACDHDNDIGTCKNQNNKPMAPASEENDEQGYQTPSSQSEATTSSAYPQPEDHIPQSTTVSHEKCTAEGFFPNPSDCTKFYRCVDNGNGGNTKYDFACGDGTAWDQNLQTCNYKNEVAGCKQTSQSSQPSKPSETSEPESEENPYQDNSNTDTEDSDSNQTPQQSQTSPESNNVNEEPSEESSSSETCTTEGFFHNSDDCTKFYRCVSNGNGGFTKYDFTCGEGTAWDQNLQTCNYKNQVASCNSTSSTQPSNTDNAETGDSDTGYNQEPSGSDSDESSLPVSGSSDGTCQSEGFFPDPNDCTKFYRCVSNGNGGFTKYDFTCGEGTAWDQNLQTCNYKNQVQSCSQTSSSQGESSTSQTSTTTESVSQTSSTAASSNQNSSNCTENQTEKPTNGNITCPKEGFYANPNDCKKFYRCVDWDSNGQKFSVFHFECGEGTIWDPALDTCNYEDSVYPPRDCSGSQSQNENDSEGTTQSTTTTNQYTTTESQTEKSTTTTEQPTTKTTTTKQITTQGTTENPTTTQKSTATEAATTEKTTTQGTTEKQPATTQSSTTESTTQQTTTDATTTQQSTTEGTTTQSTTEGTSTQQSTTEGTTTQQSTTEGTTTQQSTTEGTTTQQATEDTTTQQTTESSTTEHSTTESNAETTTEASSGESEKECPETDDDQYLYVCPTGFRRHPKYCDMFYQCTEDNESHEVKVATFNCPNNTIYDESKTQCVEEEKADKKCNGQKAQRRRFKRLNINTKQPITVSKQSHACPAVGHFPFERNEECSPAFLKCEKSKSGKLRGMIYQCPSGHVYWSVSRRCEPKSKLKNCKQSTNDWSGRWEIPFEEKNVAL